MSSKLTETRAPEAKFSFSPSYKYSVPRSSEIFNVKYYVPSSLFNSAKGNDASANNVLRNIDFEVDQKYFSNLERNANYYGRNSPYYKQYLDALLKMKSWKGRKSAGSGDDNGGGNNGGAVKFSFEEEGEFTEKRVSSIFQIEYYVKPEKSSGPLGEGTSDLKEINDIDFSVDEYYLNSLVNNYCCCLYIQLYVDFYCDCVFYRKRKNPLNTKSL